MPREEKPDDGDIVIGRDEFARVLGCFLANAGEMTKHIIELAGDRETTRAFVRTRTDELARAVDVTTDHVVIRQLTRQFAKDLQRILEVQFPRVESRKALKAQRDHARRAPRQAETGRKTLGLKRPDDG